LTYLDFHNYSALMDADLLALEDKISQTVSLCHRLRAENTELRQRMAQLTNENKRLGEKISGTRERLEVLLKRIPE
jgi:cell division protein ZapB